ncbi:hypothetical protein MXB_2556 [Myxobolus squamalis]|nr:hypothetical protein MXB_2556 [Myxobolus squamalis]
MLVLQEARKSSIFMNLTNFKGSPKQAYNFMKRNCIVCCVAFFVQFITKNNEGLLLDQIRNIGKVSVTFEMPSNFTQRKVDSLLFYAFCRQKKTLSKVKLQMNIVISVNEKSTMNYTETQLWAQKSLLMMDAAPIHKTDQTELKFTNTGTRRKLQVLDISVNKSFKSHLQKRMKNGWSMASRSSRNRDASSVLHMKKFFT